MNFQDRLLNVVGQAPVKLKANFLLAGQERTGLFPHLFLSGEKGGGKTFLAKQIAKATADIQQGREPKSARRKFLKVNAGAIKKLDDFSALMLSSVSEGPCVVFIDEAHGLSSTVTDRLLTLLEPSNENTGSFSTGAGDEERAVNINFKDVTFMFATTEKDKMFDPLLDRLEEISVEPMSDAELLAVMRTQCDNQIELDHFAEREVVGRMRGNARSAIKMGATLNSFAATVGRCELDKDDIVAMAKIMGIQPKGLTTEEVRLLKYLRSQNKAVQLQDEANYMGQSPRTVMDIERYPRNKGLMLVDGKRGITPLGRDYLDELEEMS